MPVMEGRTSHAPLIAGMDLEPMYKLLSLITVVFFAFILWIIYLADSGSRSVFFTLVQQWPNGDKVCHLLLYGLLTLLLNLALELKTLSLAGLKIYVGTLAVSVFAATEELSQAWFPSRTLDAMDLAADAAGIALFTLASVFIGWRSRHQANGRASHQDHRF